MPDQTAPAVEWWDDPDVVSWDWREPASPDALRRVLTRHGLTVTEIDTGSDQYAIRITSAPVEVLEDATCRRMWAAALRWWGSRRQRALHPQEVADRVESGALTPWADSPEPATPPAEPAHTPPADPDPHPDTGDTPGVLGRAWLGHGRMSGVGLPVLLRQADDAEDVWGSGFVRPMPRAEAEDRYGAVEVLLVDPAAWQRLREERDNLDTQIRNCLRQMDRLADEASAHEGELGDMRAQLAAAEADCADVEQLRAIRLGQHAELNDLRQQLERQQPVIEAARHWRTLLDVASDRVHLSDIRSSEDALAAAVDALTGGRSPSTDPTSPSSGDEGGTKPTPEPAGDGPGWDRPGIEGARRILPPGLANQVGALLANRDRLRVLVGEEGQPGWDNCSRAEAIRQAEEKHEFGMRMFKALETVKAELAAARLWAEEVEQDRDDAMDKVESFPERLATARRDTVAATLDEHAQYIRQRAAQSGADSHRRGLLRAAYSAERWAAEIRTGQRDTPGTEPDGDDTA